jgi:hypothetical protein
MTTPKTPPEETRSLARRLLENLPAETMAYDNIVERIALVQGYLDASEARGRDRAIRECADYLHKNWSKRLTAGDIHGLITSLLEKNNDRH